MPGIFNFPYIKLNHILRISEQEFTPKQSYHFRPSESQLLVSVKAGQMLLHGQSEQLINPGEIIVRPLTEPLTLSALLPKTIVVTINFQADSAYLHNLYQHTFTIENDSIIDSVQHQSHIISNLRRRKPEMSYDMEIGEFFIATSASLYANITKLLVDLCCKEIKNRLPLSMKQPSTLKADIQETHSGLQEQLSYARSISLPLYKKLLVNQVIQYMEANLDQSLSIDKLARTFLVSPTSLKKAFKSQTNVSIMAYFRELKITTAKRLINEHQLTITTIAAKLGFSSVHHFSTTFKNTTGFTPTQYRTQHEIK